MPVKCANLIKGGVDRLLKADYQSRRARAYAAGTRGFEMGFEYDFEREAWLKGESDDARVRAEIERGER